jgi:hypothetical protein
VETVNRPSGSVTTRNNDACRFHESDFLMSVNGYKFGAICNHCDVVAFENGAINGGKANSTVRARDILEGTS